MTDYRLALGNKAYSSWSLRAWLVLRQCGVSFEETVIPLRRQDSKTEILRHSPSGKVPALHHGRIVVWESLAIAEYLAERFPDARLWPADPDARAVARAASHEMHAGFAALRNELPMDIAHDHPKRQVSDDCAGDIDRITALWRHCRATFGPGGDYLFGGFCIADAMFAPVVTRFTTYGIALDPDCRTYADAVWAHPPLQEWRAAAREEPWVIEF